MFGESVNITVEDIPSKPVDMEYDTKAHVSAGYYYKSPETEDNFHGAIDVSTSSQPGVKALAMFNVVLVTGGWGPRSGWQLIMRIEDDYSNDNVDVKNWKGLYLVYYHLAKDPEEYFKKKVKGIKKSAGEAVGIVGGSGNREGTWKPGDADGYRLHLHLHLQPKQDSGKLGRIFNLDKFFLEKNWYKPCGYILGKNRHELK